MAEVQGLRELVPKTLEQWKKGEEGRLEEVANEVGGLKRLVENRVGRSSQQGSGQPATTPQQSQTRGNGTVPTAESTGDSSLGSKAPNKEASPQRRAGGNGGKAAIPAWQMAAANKSGGGIGKGNGDDTNEGHA